MNASASNLLSIAADLNAKGKEVTVKRLRTRGPRKGETMQRSNGYGHLTGVGSVRGADGQTASHATGAGKGGTIKRFMEHLNPRGARVVALEKPSEEEKGQWYFQRYIKHLPTAGEIVLFDRSWYNRAGVERVMGFCEPNEYLEFMRQTPELERMLVNSGIRVFKFWFSVTQEEQTRRFQKRETDPLKQWKLSPIDKMAQQKWDDYTEAKEAMFFYTDTNDAPWMVIKSDDKKRARLNCMQYFLHAMPYPNKDRRIAKAPDPLIVGRASTVIDRDNHILGKSLHPDQQKA